MRWRRKENGQETSDEEKRRDDSTVRAKEGAGVGKVSEFLFLVL